VEVSEEVSVVGLEDRRVQDVISLIRIFTPIILVLISRLLRVEDCEWTVMAVEVGVVGAMALVAVLLEDTPLVPLMLRPNQASKSWSATYD
jgi:hypothetical protein